MSLITQAQEFVVQIDPQQEMPMELIPLEVVDPSPHSFHPLEVSEPVDIEIVIEDVPGAPGSPEPEPVLEVKEEDIQEDENDAKLKKNDKWFPPTTDVNVFVAWIKEKLSGVPTHSGKDTSGVERAIAYMEKLDDVISKSMRNDVDGILDANKVEEIRAKIDDGISRLYDRLEKIKKAKKGKRKKADISFEMVKEATSAIGVKGTYIVVPLLISRIARICINSMVSAGHDIEKVYSDQTKKYKLNDREQAEVMQLLADMGYPLRQDRGYMPDEDLYIDSYDNYDWANNRKG